jgi:hypothetical protein
MAQKITLTKSYGALLAIPFAAAAILLASRPAQAVPSQCDAVAGNVVVNCGFEGGTYSSTIGGNTNNSVPNGWTPNAGFDLHPGFNFVTNSPTLVHSGSFALSIGNFDNEPAPSLSQTLTDVATATYSGSIFVLYGGAGTTDTNVFFDVQINGSNVLALNNTAPGTYTEYTFSFTGTGSDTLTLTGNTSPSEWYVDDVVVTGALAVPAPLIGLGLPAFLIVGGVFLLLGILKRRAVVFEEQAAAD